MRNILNLGLRLLAITLVAGLLLGATYEVTKGPIEQVQQQKLRASMEQVLKADEYVPGDKLPENIDSVYIAKTASGEVAGVVLEVAGKGYKGKMNVVVGINADGTVSGVRMGTNSETPTIAGRAMEPEYLDQYIGKSGSLASGKDADLVSGATFTSGGVLNAVNTALQAFSDLGVTK